MKIIDNIIGRNVLVSPLDWGLGHAARSIPIIRRLLLHNNVIVACGNSAYNFLKKELPEVEIIQIDDWKIKYPKHKINLFTILGWVPVMIRNTWHEHKIVKKIILSHRINCIVSDNRYGLLFKGIDCYIITHQVYPKMPQYLGFLENICGFFFKKYLSKFHKVLIPDFDSNTNLSGSLAAERNLHPDKFVKIGILSRFCEYNQTVHFYNENDVMVLLSGQENQRTILENMLIDTLDGCRHNVLFVRGVSNTKSTIYDTSNIRFCNILSGNKLIHAIKSSKVIICRAGYSTLCDMVALNKKCVVVIPTPGQTEQEYLANRLNGQFGFKSVLQDNKNFSTSILKLLTLYLD